MTHGLFRETSILMNREPLTKITHAVVPVFLLAFTGCASFFGPYVSEDTLYSKQAPDSETPLVAEPPDAGSGQYAVTAQKSLTESPVRPEFDIPAPAESLPEETAQPAIGSTEPTQVSPEFPVPDTSVTNELPEPQENPFAEMERQGLLQTSASVPASAAVASSHAASTFREAEPRVHTAAHPCPQECVCAPSPVARAYPDEYICDGGDRDNPVHYFGGEMQGLDTEDTVAEFKDHDGKNHVQASNRVCVYAPRFGAVRTVSGPGIDVKVDKAAGATDVAGIGALHDERGLEIGRHRSVASGVATNRSASGIENSQPAHLSEKAESIVQSAKVDQGLESKMSRGLSLLQTSDVYELNLLIQGVSTSKIRTGINTSKATTQATQTYSTFRVQSTVGSEKGGRPGKIHIVKEASPLVAKSGDVITFTIQFRNVGDYNVHDVRIIDNLTPRLTYIDGSGQIDAGEDAGGSLTAVPNKEGSQTLIFELDKPLQGGQSGTITFRAKVL